MPVLTRNSSLSLLNQLPDRVTSSDELDRSIKIIQDFISQVELPPHQVKAYSQLELSGNKLQQSLKDFVPKVQAAIDANVLQSKALSKLLASISMCLSYVVSDDYTSMLVDKMLDSEGLSELIEQKVSDKMDEMNGTGRRKRARTGVPETPMRAPRKMELEHPLHWAVHRLVGKSYAKQGKTVVSTMTDWPEPEVAGFVEEAVAGALIRRWRPDWDSAPAGTPFETAVVQVIADEFGPAVAPNDIKKGLREYMVSISRARKEKESGLQATKKAETNRRKRSTKLRETMIANFAGSVLNACSDRAFYLAMFDSMAFSVLTCTRIEPHGLKTPEDLESDGSLSAYDGFQIYADLWFASRQDPDSVVMVEDVDWWSPKARRAFWLLYEESRPAPGKKTRLPLFHVPQPLRPRSTLATLPRLPLPALPTDSPAAAMAPAVETFPLTTGMINPDILTNAGGNFDTWTNLLGEDPEVDSNLPPLDELLSGADKRDLKRRAEAHMKLPVSLSLDHLRKMWRIKQEGSDEMYAGILKGRSPGQQAAEVTEEQLQELMYD